MNRAKATQTLASRIGAPRPSGCSRRAEASALRILRAIAQALAAGLVVVAFTGDAVVGAAVAAAFAAGWFE